MRPQDGAAASGGFQSLEIELKMRLWEEKDRLFYPVLGPRTSLLTNVASRHCQLGKQPGLSLLADHFLPGGFKLEWNVGSYASNPPNQPGGTSLPCLGVQWSLQKPLTDRLTIPSQGCFNGGNLPAIPERIVRGFGGQWSVTQRLAVSGTAPWCLEPYGSPVGGSPVGGWAGFAYAC